MTLHEKAVYEDENKNWVTVTYQELISSTAQFRAKLRDKSLLKSKQVFITKPS